MKKNLANNFLRGILPFLFITFALIAVFFPSDRAYAYSAGCRYDERYGDAFIQEQATSTTFSNLTINSLPTITAGCTQADKAELVARIRAARAAVDATLAGPDSPARTALLTEMRGEGGKSDVKCDNFIQNAFLPVCWARLISVVIGSLLIAIAAMFLALADMLFNWTVLNTILLFSTEIFDKVAPGINVGWTAMRDIANIVIIGMFTFIAISTILGIQEYAAKKLLARVLIIAVLINFSLLFTKLIIDVSNFTASQFYASTVGANSVRDARDRAEGRVVGTVTSGSLDSYRGRGISGEFINFLGVTSVSKTWERLDGIANAGERGGWYVALAHGLLGALLLGGAAGVLFYGAYLLVSRAVLFIFLMVTAAGAFATHLIPKMNESTYGWSGWWSSLLHNAALAPLLMIFLYITLRVSASITPRDGTLALLATPEATNVDINRLFLYLLILGLLWGSFLLASKWASKVGGLKFTGTLLSSAAVAPFALASRFVAAPLMRTTFGRGAMARSMALGSEIKDNVRHAATIDRTTDAGKREYQKTLDAITAKMKERDRIDRLAKGSFNAANIKPIQAGIKALGVPGLISGLQAKPKGYADDAKERAEHAIKDAEKLVLKKDDFARPEERNKVRDDMIRKRMESQNYRNLRAATASLENTAALAAERRDDPNTGVNALTAQLARAQADETSRRQSLDIASRQRDAQATAVGALKATKVTADSTIQQAEAKKTEILTASHAKMADLDRIIRDNAAGSQAHTDALTGQAAERAQRIAAIQNEDNKIRAAQQQSTTLSQQIQQGEQTLTALNASVQTATADLSAATGAVTQLEGQIATLNNDVAVAVDNLAQNLKAITPTDREIDAEILARISKSKGLAIDTATENVHHRYTNILNRFLGQTEDGDTMARFTRKQAESSAGIKYKELTEMWKTMTEQVGGGGGAAAAQAGTPASSGTAAPPTHP